MYCSDECKAFVKQDQWRDSKRNLRKKSYNRRASELQLGSKGTIGSKPKNNFEEEAIQVHKELLRIQGKTMTRTEYAVTLKRVKEAIP